MITLTNNAEHNKEQMYIHPYYNIQSEKNILRGLSIVLDKINKKVRRLL